MINDWKHKEQHKKMISLEKDLPIQHVNEDLLNRDHFAKQLAEAVTAYMEQPGNTDGLVIGLEGPWGSGKTSLFNLMKEHLGNQCIVKTFNAWLTSDKVGLTTEFFRILTDFSEDESIFTTKKVRKYAEKVINSAAQATTISLPASATFSVGKFSENLLGQPSLVKQKEKIVSSIKKEENQKWMVLFIDDLDRLSYDEIGTVFQLIKNIADFPKVIYVLAYDHEIVANALDKIQADKGDEYLQKVVQVVYDIPMPESENIHEHLLTRVREIIQSDERYSYDKDHLNSLLNAGIFSYLKNIRNCNRVVNAFYLKYLLCGTVCDVGDLLAITVLELFEPDVYKCLWDKNYLLLRKNLGFFEIMASAFNEYDFSALDKLKVNDRSACEDILRKLFPQGQFSFDFSGFYNNKTVKKDVFPDKISNSKCFERYFCLSVKSTEVPINQINEFVHLADEEKIYEQLVEWGNHSRCGYVFQQLQRFIKNGEIPNIDQYIEMFLHAASRFYEDCPSEFFKIFSSGEQGVLVEKMIKKYIFEDGDKKINFDSVRTLFDDKSISVYVLQYIFEKYFAIVDSIKHSVKFRNTISKAVCEQLLQPFRGRLKEFIVDENLYKSIDQGRAGDKVRNLLLTWKRIDYEEYKAYVGQKHSDFVQILFTIFFINIIEFNDRTEYRLISNLQNDYDAESFYKRNKVMDGKEDLEKLYGIDVKRIVLAYIQIYENSRLKGIDLYQTSISEEQIDELIEK